MLTQLYIRNLGLIDTLSLSLGAGLTVITGETGAGKSIFLEAILLLSGARANLDSLREGADEIDVMAHFCLDPASKTRLSRVLCSLGLPDTLDEDFSLRRVISKNTRRQFLNQIPLTVAQLKEIAEELIDFTSQHAQHALMQPKGQLQFLDAYGQHQALLNELSDRLKTVSALKTQLEDLTRAAQERDSKIDWLTFQIDEIDKIDPKPGELERLSTERDGLANWERLKTESLRALNCLRDSDEGVDAFSSLNAAQKALGSIKAGGATLEQALMRLEEARALLDDCCMELDRIVRRDEDDGASLAQIEDRIGDIKELLRKHPGDVDALLVKKAQMLAQLQQLKGAEASFEALTLELKKAQRELFDCANELTKARKKAASRLTPLIQKELVDLGLKSAVFEIQVLPHEGAVHQSGADSIRFLFGANQGEPANALEKVASGGELSRVLLAIKRVLMERDLTLVSIFDEVDTGVSGAIGQAIGEKLKAISKGRQVLCVTHLAQVAALADMHLKVEKEAKAQRTVSRIFALERAARIEELARIMGGRDLTDLTLQHAREVLDRAQEVSA